MSGLPVTKTRPQEAASVEEIGAMLWGFRLELVLLAVAGGAYAGLFLAAHLTAVAAGAIVLAAAIGLLSVGAVRRALVRGLHAAQVRRRWRLAWMHCGLAPVRAGRVERMRTGERIAVRVSRGSSFEELGERAEQLACCLSLRELRVERDPGDASRGTVTLVRRDLLAGLARTPWPELDAPKTSLWEPIPLGLDEHGGTVEVSLVERSLLAGGEPGAGKSAAMSMLIATAALDPSARLWLLDGKLVELAPWQACAERMAGPDVGEAIELLEQVREEMEHRYRELLNNGLRKIAPEAGLPLHVVACDELAFYLTCEDRKERTRFAELLRDLVARGRAAGIVVLAATQKPSADVVPSALRDLFGFRLALRCTTPQASDTILGQGWASRGHNAGTISPADRGVGFLLAEDGLPVKLRTFYLDDEHIRALAARARAQRDRISAGLAAGVRG
jgi:DNA translocase FtsK/SpoIIIE-like protein